MTYRQAAAALSLLVMAYGLWRTDPRGRDGALSAMAAYLAFGWFMVTTRAHENHASFALPLLVMATPTSRFAWWMFWLLSLTLFLNMAYHDFGLEAWRLARFTLEEWQTLQLINAGLNVDPVPGLERLSLAAPGTVGPRTVADTRRVSARASQIRAHRPVVASVMALVVAPSRQSFVRKLTAPA